MTTEVKCKLCGRIINSTTVTKESYKAGEEIDRGCPYCGNNAPLLAVSAKKKPKVEKVEEKPDVSKSY